MTTDKPSLITPVLAHKTTGELIVYERQQEINRLLHEQVGKLGERQDEQQAQLDSLQGLQKQQRTHIGQLQSTNRTLILQIGQLQYEQAQQRWQFYALCMAVLALAFCLVVLVNLP